MTVPDTQSHCLVCPSQEEARDKLDLTCIEDMVTFYQRILNGREEMEKKEKKRRKRTAKLLHSTECRLSGWPSFYLRLFVYCLA